MAIAAASASATTLEPNAAHNVLAANTPVLSLLADRKVSCSNHNADSQGTGTSRALACLTLTSAGYPQSLVTPARVLTATTWSLASREKPPYRSAASSVVVLPAPRSPTTATPLPSLTRQLACRFTPPALTANALKTARQTATTECGARYGSPDGRTWTIPSVSARPCSAEYGVASRCEPSTTTHQSGHPAPSRSAGPSGFEH